MTPRKAAFDKLILPIGLSLPCLLILAGGWTYSGSLLPSTEGASINEAIVMWVVSALLFAIPIVTICLWVVTVRRYKKLKG